MRKKLISICIVIVISLLAICSLVGCNKKKTKVVYTDIYKNSSSQQEYTGFQTLMSLPSNVSIVTESTGVSRGGDYGYLPEMDAFVVKDSTTKFINLVKSGENKAMIRTTDNEGDYGFNLAIVAIKCAYGRIAVIRADGRAEVYNTEGRIVVNNSNFHNISDTTKIEDVLNILSSELLAVNFSYDSNFNTSSYGSIDYASVYRMSNGVLHGLIRNESGKVSAIEGADDYVVTFPTESSESKTSRIYKIGHISTKTTDTITCSERATFRDDSTGSDYYSEVVYLGQDTFYVYQDWVVESTKPYTYYYVSTNDNNEEEKTYYKVNRYLYNAKEDSRQDIDTDIIFMSLTNKYHYNATYGGISATEFLNDGYMYASYCIVIDEYTKEGSYDQMILDSNLSIIMSLSGNFGITLREQDVTDVSFYDLVIQYVDDIGIVSLMPSVVKAYDIYGNVLFTNSEYSDIISCNLNNGMIIANATIDDTVYYGAFNLKGQLVVPFKYLSLTSYMGDYAIGKRKVDGNNIFELIGKDGVVVTAMSDHSTPLNDFAYDSSGNPIYRVGVYMYRMENPDTSSSIKYFYGFKNFNTDVNKNKIIDANVVKFVSGTSLYSPKNYPKYVFVLGKYKDDSRTYIYKIV